MLQKVDLVGYVLFLGGAVASGLFNEWSAALACLAACFACSCHLRIAALELKIYGRSPL